MTVELKYKRFIVKLLRKVYDPELGAIGTAFEDYFANELIRAGAEIISQVGKTIDSRAPADIKFKVGEKVIDLQLEKREYDLRTFSTIHLPDESLDFELLVEQSNTGEIYVVPVEFIRWSPRVIVPNKYDGGRQEHFYDIPSVVFKVLSSVTTTCEWLVNTYGKSFT